MFKKAEISLLEISSYLQIQKFRRQKYRQKFCGID